MELKPLKFGIIVGNRVELGILTSLALKCRNLSLCDPNEMIPIPTKNRFIEINFLEGNMSKLWLMCPHKIFQVKGYRVDINLDQKLVD